MLVLDYSEVIYLISNAFRIFAINLFLEVFFLKKNLRWSGTAQKGVFITYFMINSGVYLFIQKPMLTVLTNAILFSVLTLPYKSSMWRRIFGICSIFMIGVICEGIVARTAMLLYGPSPLIEIITYVLSNFLLYIIILIMKRFFGEHEEMVLPRMHWLCIAIIPCISSVADIVLILGGYEQWINVIIILGLFLINIAFFYLYVQVVEKYEVELQNQSLAQQNKAYHQQALVIHAAENNIRSLQHDFKNHLIALKEVSNTKSEKFRDYVQVLEGKLTFNAEYVMTGNKMLDGLINYKLQVMYDMGVEIDLNIKIPDDINIHDFDVVVILGNLLDNAIRSLQEQDNGIFQMKFLYNRGTFYLQLRNSYAGILRKKGNTFFSTKKESSEPHGIGLNNVKRIVEKYNGNLTINVEKNFFDVEILMYI